MLKRIRERTSRETTELSPKELLEEFQNESLTENLKLFTDVFIK